VGIAGLVVREGSHKEGKALGVPEESLVLEEDTSLEGHRKEAYQEIRLGQEGHRDPIPPVEGGRIVEDTRDVGQMVDLEEGLVAAEPGSEALGEHLVGDLAAGFDEKDPELGQQELELGEIRSVNQ